MRNADQWTPSKFVYHRGVLRGSRDPKALGIASRVIADLTARFYQRELTKFAKGQLLDLGCGKVPFYGVYKDLVSEAVCVDWSNTLHANPYVDHEIDLNGPIGLRSDSFDTVILSEVLEHIRKPEILMSEMHRLLRSGGHVIMNVPFYYGLHEQPFDYFRYTRHALRSMAEDAGLTVVHLESIGGVPEIIADLVSKTAMTVPAVGRITARVVQRFTGWFVSIGIGKRLSQRTSADFPFGYGLVLRKD